MPHNSIKLNDTNLRINTITGMKSYRKVKEVLSKFDEKLADEMGKPVNANLDQVKKEVFDSGSKIDIRI